MALIVKNGQIHHIPTKKGKQKGFVIKNGQISTLIPYRPTDVVVEEEEEETGDDYGHIVMGVAVANIAKVNGVATANIEKVIGV